MRKKKSYKNLSKRLLNEGGPIKRTSVQYGTPEYKKAYEEGRIATKFDPSTMTYDLMDLPEFTVTGKDERIPEAMSQAGSKFWGTALDLMSEPQRKMMEGITGTYQYPSEAMGFDTLDKPWYSPQSVANFAIDSLIDPSNVLGTGLIKSATKLGSKGFGKKTIPTIALNDAVSLKRKKIKSSVEDISKGYDLSNTGFDKDPMYHKQLFEDAKERVLSRLSTDKGKKRLQNFINENYKKNPEQFGTLNERFIPWLKSGFKDYTKITPDRVIDDLRKMEFAPTNSINLDKDNAFHWFREGLDNPSIMGLGHGNTPYDALHTFEHELAHFFQRNKVSTVDDILSNLKLKTKKDSKVGLNLAKSEVPFTEGYSITRTNPNYVDFESPLKYFQQGSRGQEKMPFLAELRENLLQRGIINDYYDDITPELLRKHKDLYDKTGGYKYIQRLYEIMEDTPENLSILSQALNKMPQLALPIAGGAAGASMLLGENEEEGKIQMKKGGQLIKRADGSYSKRGLWDNIRANRGSGRKPTPQMLEQERKIKKKYFDGGELSLIDKLFKGDPTSAGGDMGFGAGNPMQMAASFGSSFINTDSVGGKVGAGALQGAGMGAQFGPIGAGVGALAGGGMALVSGLIDKKQQDEMLEKRREADEKRFDIQSRSILSNYPTQGVGSSGFYQDGGKVVKLSLAQDDPLYEKLNVNKYRSDFLKIWNSDPKIKKFRDSFIQNFGYDPDPFDKESKYDYVGAVFSGDRPEIDPEDGLYHWSSKYKADDHPNRFVKGIDTRGFKNGGKFTGSDIDSFLMTGGYMNPIANGVSIAKGQSHEQGGINLYDGMDNFAEIEGGEVVKQDKVYSDTLTVPDFALKALGMYKSKPKRKRL